MYLAALGHVRTLTVEGNAGLKSISLPYLDTADSVRIAHNAALEVVVFSELTQAGSLSILGNASYPQCLAEALLAQLVGFSGTADVSGNKTTAACVPCTGDVALTSSQEVSAFAARGCTSLSGTLSIAGSALSSVTLPALTAVGSLEVENTALTSLSLPALALVHDVQACGWQGAVCFRGLLVRDNPSLSSLGLPALTVAGTVQVSGNAVLTSLDLPALVTVPDRACQGDVCGGEVVSLYLPGNTALASVNLPALTAGTVILGSAGLTSLDLPALTVGDVRISGATALASLSLPALTNADSLGVNGNTALKIVSAPALIAVADNLDISGNPSLTTLSLPRLTGVGYALTIKDNTDYPQCAASALLALLVAPAPGMAIITGNDTDAHCPP